MLKKLAIIGGIFIAIGLVGASLTWSSFAETNRLDSSRFGQYMLTDINHQIPLESNLEFGMEIIAEYTDVQFKMINSQTSSPYIQIRGSVPADLAEALKQTRIINNQLNLNLAYDQWTNNRNPSISMDIRFSDPSLVITIYASPDVVLDQFNLESNFSDLEFNAITAKQINIQSTYGDIEANRITGEQLVIDTEFGDTKLERINTATKINSIYGDVEISQTEVQPLEIYTEYGDVEIQPARAFRGFYDTEAEFGTIEKPRRSPESTDLIIVRTQFGDIEINERGNN